MLYVDIAMDLETLVVNLSKMYSPRESLLNVKVKLIQSHQAMTIQDRLHHQTTPRPKKNLRNNQHMRISLRNMKRKRPNSRKKKKDLILNIHRLKQHSSLWQTNLQKFLLLKLLKCKVPAAELAMLGEEDVEPNL